jgi:serine/threonine-protein kinase
VTFAQPFSGYEILGRIGAGAMGTVFKARHRKLNRIVALKVLKPALARNERFVDRLRREARIVASLDHPNIVKGYDLGEEGGYHYFVMEYVEGRSLRDLLAEWGAFPPEKVLDLAIQVAQALDHALARGVIHRDIKPGNILIDARGKVKLTDMGLAKGPADVTITRDGATVGTPQYISPEQARNPQQADVRSDLYSLGATLYHMATGTPPFRGETMAEVIHQVLHDQPRPPSELDPGVGEGLSLVLRKLLAKDPAARYQLPAELLADLGRILRDERPAVDVRVLQSAARWGRRRVGRWAVAAAIAVLVAGAGYALWPPPDPAASPQAGGDADFRAALLAALAEKPYPARFAELDRRAAANGDAARRAVIAELVERTERSLRAELDRFFDEYVDRTAQTKERLREPEHWRDAEAFFAEEVAAAMRERFGYRPESLPLGVRDYVQTVRVPVLREHLQRWCRERDEGHLAALREHLATAVAAAWQEPMEREPPDFARALRDLDAAIAGFHGADGRPERSQLGAELAQRAAAEESAARAAATEAIGRRAGQARAALEQELRAGLAALETGMDQGVAADALRARFTRLQASLAEAYPPERFAGHDNPWPPLSAELRAFAERLEHVQRFRDATALDRALRLAYARLAATARADAAIEWLRGSSLTPEMAALRDRHLALLADVRDAAAKVCLALLGSGERRMLQLARRDGAGEVEVEVVREPGGGRLLLRDQARAPLPVSSISFRDLLARAGDPAAGLEAAERQRLRNGLAVWLAMGGDTASVPDYLDPSAHAFFREHLEELIERARGHQRRTDVSALGVLAALNSSLTAGDAAGVRDALAAFRAAGFGEQTLEGDGQFLVVQAQSWLAREEARERARRALAARFDGEVTIDVAPDGAVELDYDLGRIARAEGWALDGGRLAFAAEAVTLSDASRRTLRVPTHLGSASQLELRLRVRFPAVASGARLYVLESCGAAAVLGVLESGMVAAAILPAPQASGAADLRRALQAPLREAAAGAALSLCADASYELELLVDASRQRRMVELRVAATTVARTVLSGAGDDQSISLVPLAPLIVEGLRVRALTDE